MIQGRIVPPQEALQGLLAAARDLAIDALERGQPVAWVGGPLPSVHHGSLLVAYPVPFVDGRSYWAVRYRGHAGHWYFRPYSYIAVRRTSGTAGIAPLEDTRKLTKPYYWTLRRVQNAVARCYGLLDLTELPDSVRSAISFTTPPPPAPPDKDRIRARRREKQRESMSPAEKERFDQHWR